MKVKTIVSGILALGLISSAFAIPKGTVESTSRADWVSKKFISNISMDTVKAQLQMPSGKKQASAHIKMKMPQVIQRPLLSLYVDSRRRLSDYILSDEISLVDVYNMINNGYKTPDVFSSDSKKLNTTNTIDINGMVADLVKHPAAYTPEEPIESVPSRPYTGIIIDARGKLPVHGEYIKDNASPCFFPTIWDENMNVIYEKSVVQPSVIREKGLIAYDFQQETSERIGSDPLYIRAVEVFGRNRTDPIIKRSDALKILTVPENVKLLNEGKVVILLDKQNLVYDVSVSEKDEAYYVLIEKIRGQQLTNLDPSIHFEDDDGTLKYIVQLNFYPDSAKLLPGEDKRINLIVEDLRKILDENGYTVLIEGHTADVGKPVGQLNLSVDRALTVMNALIAQGLDKNIFSYKGYGGTDPVATNTTEEGRAQNRRVEIIAKPRATYIQRDW